MNICRKSHVVTLIGFVSHFSTHLSDKRSMSNKGCNNGKDQCVHSLIYIYYIYNSAPPSAAYICQWIESALVHIMACYAFGAKPLSEPMLDYCQMDSLIPAWIKNYMSSKVWEEITYPFPNFNGCTIEVWEWISNFISHYIRDIITYPCWD